MNAHTHCLFVQAPHDKVFGYLSRVENLPHWAKEFCRKLEDVEGQHWVTDRDGNRIMFRIQANAATGVVDMFGGPSESQMAYWPARVVPLAEKQSLFLFTLVQYPGISDEVFGAQCAALNHELLHIRTALE